MKKLLVLLTLCLSMTAFADLMEGRNERFNHIENFEANSNGGFNCKVCNGAHIPVDRVEEHIAFHEELERLGMRLTSKDSGDRN